VVDREPPPPPRGARVLLTQPLRGRGRQEALAALDDAVAKARAAIESAGDDVELDGTLRVTGTDRRKDRA
jgi:hypothetical protein